jgi:hypothetical protein
MSPPSETVPTDNRQPSRSLSRFTLSLVSIIRGEQPQDHEPDLQLTLFPNQIPDNVSQPANSRNRRPIKLPRSILQIAPGEQLHQYLSRVAAAAMAAATRSCGGSTTLAALRLGTAANINQDQQEPDANRPHLALAASQSPRER